TGSFDLGTKVSGASGINYSGFGVTTLTGSGSGATITGSGQTYTLTGANAGNNGTIGWTSFGNIADSGSGTLIATNQAWALTGANQGTVGDLSGTFTGIGSLIDTGKGYISMHSGADGSLSGSLNAGSQGTLDYSGYTTTVNINLGGGGTTGIGGTVAGISAIKADSDLAVNGSLAGPLAITVTNPGATTTLGLLNVGTDLSLNTDGAVQQASGPLTIGGTTTIQAGGAIALTNSGNDFVGAVMADGAGIALADKNDLTIAALIDSGNNNVSLVAGGALTLPNGAIDAGTGNLSFTASGTLSDVGALSGKNIALNGDAGVNLAGNIGASSSLTIGSHGGAINQTAGVISTGTLTGSSTGSTSLNGANQIGTLGNFSANGFSLSNAQVLTVAGTISGGAGATNIATTAGALTVYGDVSGSSVALSGQGGLGINGNVDSGAGTTVLDSAGDISEGGNSVITAGTLTGNAGGATALDGANAITSLGNFMANGFSLNDAQALDVSGTVNGGNGTTSVTTTAGMLTVTGSVAGGAVKLAAAGIAINGGVDSGSGTTTLSSTGGISEGSNGVVTAGTLIGNASGAATLGGANAIGDLGGFSANGISLTNAQAMTVTGAVNSGGGATSLTTTAGTLTIGGNLAGSAVTLDGGSGLAINASVDSGSGTTTLLSDGAISEGGNGAIIAGMLTGQSTGSTTLDPANRVATLGNFTANGFTLLNGQALTVTGNVNGGSGITLQTTSGGLQIDGALSAQRVSLQSAGTIDGGTGGSITADTLTGSAVDATTLGTATQFMGNYVGTLGGFDSPAGFSFTDAQGLTLASVNGSAYTVNAGTSALYLGVQGDLLQQGTTWAYDGSGTWSATGQMGTAAAPIYVTGVTEELVSLVGTPPAYFYAVNAQGGLLPVVGAPSVNVPTSALTSRAQNGNNHGDAYIDPSVVTANYRSFGIVPSGILLPPDQQDCQPGQPYSASCPDND
ncbi:MAG: S-layer family protein, partial [Xanthomonadaceae bacterium]|nr:S-layer family protein [Xanthomonadaceae bacterium]